MKVIIPQDLNEITLKQMIKLADIEKLEIDEVEKAKEVIKLLVDKVDDSNINRIKVLDLLAMYKKLCAMTNTETSLIKLVSIEGLNTDSIQTFRAYQQASLWILICCAKT